MTNFTSVTRALQATPLPVPSEPWLSGAGNQTAKSAPFRRAGGEPAALCPPPPGSAPAIPAIPVLHKAFPSAPSALASSLPLDDNLALGISLLPTLAKYWHEAA